MEINEIQSLAILYRGTIINYVVDLERLIDFYLAQYFCSEEEKQDELILIILSNEKIGFESKRQVFLQLIKSKSLPIYTNYPELANDIQKIITDRNVLAHYLLDITDDAKKLPEGTIRFHKLKNNHLFIEYTSDKIKDLSVRIKKLISYMIEYIR